MTSYRSHRENHTKATTEPISHTSQSDSNSYNDWNERILCVSVKMSIYMHINSMQKKLYRKFTVVFLCVSANILNQHAVRIATESLPPSLSLSLIPFTSSRSLSLLSFSPSLYISGVKVVPFNWYTRWIKSLGIFSVMAFPGIYQAGSSQDSIAWVNITNSCTVNEY